MNASQGLHPADGARYLFELEGQDSEVARYRAAIFTPTERFDYAATLSLAGESTVEAAPGGAGPELEKRLGNFARQLARAAAGKAQSGLVPWPPRLLRWRGPGRG